MRLKIGILLILLSQICSAAPQVYTLEGFVSGMYGDTDANNRAGVAYGDYVKYVVVVDKDRRGYSISDGVTTYAIDEEILDSGSYKNYYAELIEASHTIESTYFDSDRVSYIASDIDSPSYPDGPFTRITVGRAMLNIDSSRYIEEWEINEWLVASYLWHDNVNGQYATMRVGLQVSAIEDYSYQSPDQNESENIDISKNGGSFSAYDAVFLLVLSFLFVQMHNKSFKPTALRAAA